MRNHDLATISPLQVGAKGFGLDFGKAYDSLVGLSELSVESGSEKCREAAKDVFVRREGSLVFSDEELDVFAEVEPVPTSEKTTATIN